MTTDIRRRRIGRAMLHIVMAILLIAGTAKLVDLPAFESDLRTWQLLPASSIAPLTIIVPSVELLAAGLWFVRIWNRSGIVIGTLLLSTFSFAYVAHLVFAHAPRCGCFGKLLQFEQSERSAEVAIARNLLLLALLASGCFLDRVRQLSENQIDFNSGDLHNRVDIQKSPHRSGFSLTEMLLVIIAFAILISMIIPSLAGVRSSAYRIVSLANLRTHTQVFNTYGDDYKELFPYSMDANATYTIRRHTSGATVQLVYFAGINTWHWPMMDSHYSETLDNDVFVDPNSADLYPFSVFWYSAVFLARPEFWDEATRTGPAQWRPTSHADVLFPSKKGILFNSRTMFPLPDAPSDPLQRIDIGFVDSSARAVPANNLSSPYLRGEGSWHGSWFGNGIKVMHTIDGVRGRDEQ